MATIQGQTREKIGQALNRAAIRARMRQFALESRTSGRPAFPRSMPA